MFGDVENVSMFLWFLPVETWVFDLSLFFFVDVEKCFCVIMDFCWMYKNTKIMSNVSILVVSLRTVYDDINLTPLRLVHSVHKLQLNFDLG